MLDCYCRPLKPGDYVVANGLAGYASPRLGMVLQVIESQDTRRAPHGRAVVWFLGERAPRTIRSIEHILWVAPATVPLQALRIFQQIPECAALLCANHTQKDAENDGHDLETKAIL